MIQPGYVQTPSHLLYYELLDVTLTELETKKSVKVTWMGLNNKEEGVHTFLMAKTANFGEIIDNLSKNVKLSKSPQSTGRIRLFEIAPGGRTQKIFQGNELIKDYQSVTLDDLFAEEVHIDEQQVKENEEKLITCYHFNKEPTKSHGAPFRFVLKQVSEPPPLPSKPVPHLVLTQCDTTSLCPVLPLFPGRGFRRHEEEDAATLGNGRQGVQQDQVSWLLVHGSLEL